MRVQFLQETLVLFNIKQSMSVFVFRLLNSLVQKTRHLGIFCGVNNSLFLLSSIHQTPSLLCLYLDDSLLHSSLSHPPCCAGCQSEKACYNLHRKLKKNQKNPTETNKQNSTLKFPKKRKKARTFPFPMECEPLPCPWGALASKARLNASSTAAGNRAHVGGEILLSLRRSLLCFSLTAKKICAGL